MHLPSTTSERPLVLAECQEVALQKSGGQAMTLRFGPPGRIPVGRRPAPVTALDRTGDENESPFFPEFA